MRKTPGIKVARRQIFFGGTRNAARSTRIVYQALHEAGIEPDWVIGTSIGAINASLIAGNKPEHRLAKLEEFWNRVGQIPALEVAASVPWAGCG